MKLRLHSGEVESCATREEDKALHRSYEEFDRFDPYLETSVTRSWIKEYLEGDKIRLKTYIPVDRLEEVLKRGLELPLAHKKQRTDSGLYEDNAIFATTFSGWRDRSLIEFKVPMSKVYIRSTYNSRVSEHRFKENLKVFVRVWETTGRPPFDPNRAEFLIYENISPSNFVRVVEEQKQNNN